LNEFGIEFSSLAVMLNYGINLTVTNVLIIDGTVENLALLSVKYITFRIFSDKESETHKKFTSE